MQPVAYRAAAKRIAAAANQRELDRVSHLIQHVEGTSNRDFLARLYKSKADVFKQK